MGHPSRSPARIPTAAPEGENAPVRTLRPSRTPSANAIIMPRVAETFRRLGTAPPGRAANDGAAEETLTDDELFAIWQAHLQ